MVYDFVFAPDFGSAPVQLGRPVSECTSILVWHLRVSLRRQRRRRMRQGRVGHTRRARPIITTNYFHDFGLSHHDDAGVGSTLTFLWLSCQVKEVDDKMDGFGSYVFPFAVVVEVIPFWKRTVFCCRLVFLFFFSFYPVVTLP